MKNTITILRRAALAGEYILTLCEGEAFAGDGNPVKPRYRAGQILRVVRLASMGPWDGSAVMYEHPDSNLYIIRHENYVVLDGYKPEIESFSFSQLSDEAKAHAYGEYVKSMDDDLNRDSIVTFEAYCADADWDGLAFDAEGNCLG